MPWPTTDPNKDPAEHALAQREARHAERAPTPHELREFRQGRVAEALAPMQERAERMTRAIAESLGGPDSLLPHELLLLDRLAGYLTIEEGLMRIVHQMPWPNEIGRKHLVELRATTRTVRELLGQLPKPKRERAAKSIDEILDAKPTDDEASP